MKSQEYFGRVWDCACGKTHRIRPIEFLYAEDAVDRLPDIAARAVGKGAHSALVLMDERTAEVAGQAVLATLIGAGWEASMHLVADPAPGRDPICDDITAERIVPDAEGKSLLVPVGSGVLSDLAKMLARQTSTEVVTFATAASMNGYTSANIAPTLRGVKSLLHGRSVYAVVSSPEVIAHAPDRMTSAGLGDVLAKSVSSADWWMNHRLFGDYFCPAGVELIAEIEPLYLHHPEALRDREPAALAGLFDALQLTGVAMTMAESSAPASGGEHLISHTLDMLADLHGRPHDLHGRQVGVGTILCAQLYQRILSLESPEWTDPSRETHSELWGPLAADVAARYAEKLSRLDEARRVLSRGDAWDELRRGLSERVRCPETIHDCLRRAGAAVTPADVGVSPEHLALVVQSAREIRARFTVLDVATMAGILPLEARELVDSLGDLS